MEENNRTEIAELGEFGLIDHLTKNNETITTNNGVTIIGDSNIPSSMPSDASKMYGKNILNFLKLILKEGNMNVNLEDDIVRGTCITHKKEVISQRVKDAMEKQTI